MGRRVSDMLMDLCGDMFVDMCADPGAQICVEMQQCAHMYVGTQRTRMSTCRKFSGDATDRWHVDTQFYTVAEKTRAAIDLCKIVP